MSAAHLQRLTSCPCHRRCQPRGLDPGSGDNINGSSNDGCADLDRRSDDRDCRIGYAKTSTAAPESETPPWGGALPDFLTGLASGEAGHVDHQPVAHIAFQHPVVSAVDVIHRDQFDIRHEVVLGTEVEHFLRFANATNQGTGDAAAPQYQPEDIWRWMWLGRGTDQGHRAIPLEQLQIGIEVVRRRDGVEDEIELAGVARHIVGVGGDTDLIRTQALAVGDLAYGSGE